MIRYLLNIMLDINQIIYLKFYNLCNRDKFVTCFFGTYLFTFILFNFLLLFFIIIDLGIKDLLSLRKNNKLRHILKQVYFNGLICHPALLFIFSWMAHDKFRYDKLPSLYEINIQIIIMVVIFEITLFTLHRIEHLPILYNKIHKVHHEYTKPIGIMLTYCHPLEYCFVMVIPVFTCNINYHA